MACRASSPATKASSGTVSVDPPPPSKPTAMPTNTASVMVNAIMPAVPPGGIPATGRYHSDEPPRRRARAHQDHAFVLANRGGRYYRNTCRHRRLRRAPAPLTPPILGPGSTATDLHCRRRPLPVVNRY